MPEDSNNSNPFAAANENEEKKNHPFATDSDATEPKNTTDESTNPFAVSLGHDSSHDSGINDISHDDTLNEVMSTEEEGDELIVEEDGDVFWVIQNIVWSIAKSILLIGVIGLLIWFVWGESINVNLPKWNLFSRENIQKITPKVTNTKTPTKQPTNKSTDKIARHEIAGVQNEGLTAAQWNFWLENKQDSIAQDTMSRSIRWFRSVERFFDVTPQEMIQGKDKNERGQRIASLLRRIKELRQEGFHMQNHLQENIAKVQKQLNPLTAQSTTKDTLLTTEIAKNRGYDFRKYLDEKIAIENTKFTYQTELWANQTLLQKVVQYDVPLANLETNITTNRQALVHGIKVVEFPNDPFQRVLQPEPTAH